MLKYNKKPINIIGTCIFLKSSKIIYIRIYNIEDVYLLYYIGIASTVLANFCLINKKINRVIQVYM